MKNTITPEFELLVAERLSALADHAPATVRSAVDVSDLALRPAEERTTPKRRIAGIGALVVALGGGFALTTIAATGGHDGGASTPEAAVEDFIGALEQRDVLGALDLLDPAESDALVDVVRRAADEAVRVGLLSDDANLSNVPGAFFGVESLTMSTEIVAPDLAVVRLTGGLVDVQFDMASLPFTEQLRSRTSSEGLPNEAVDLAGEDLQLATVKREGRWYVSAGFSIAEAARRSAGVDYPVEPPDAPEGFASPEEAVTAFWERLAGFDMQGAIATAAPGEGDALARYASLWLPSVDRALADSRASGTAVTVSGLTYDVKGDDDHRGLTPTAYVVEGTLPPPTIYDDYPPFDPDAPILIHRFTPRGEVGFLLIPAGEPIPDTFDVADFSADYPVEFEAVVFNTAQLNEDGTIQTFWVEDEVAAEPSTEPQPFRYELADGCTTMTGAAFDNGGPAGGFIYPGSGVERVSDEVWRACSDQTAIQSIGALSVLLLRPGLGAAPQLPTIEVVEIDGQWYVSPIRTVFASVLDTFAAIPDGAVFSIDSPIAPILYGTSRTGLEQLLIGLDAADVAPGCAAIVVTDAAGVVTGLLDEFPTTGLEECFYGAMSTSDLYAAGDTAVDFEVGPADAAPATDVVVSD